MYFVQIHCLLSCSCGIKNLSLLISGSDAVERYAHIDLKERFRLMCFAFDEQEYEADDNLTIIQRETAKSNDKVKAFLDGLNNDEMKRLLEMMRKKM